MDEARRHFKFPIGGATVILKHGQFFLPEPKPKSIAWAPSRMCFMNAAQLALADERLTYVEGFAHSGLIPVEHAWVVDADGKLIDNTWRKIGLAYLGVPLTLACLKQSLVANGYYGVFGGMGRMPYIYTLKARELKRSIKKLNHDPHPQTQKERRIRGRVPVKDRR